jgi:hypothetical protein
VSALRAVLAAVLEARPGTGLDDIARRLELSRDEVEAMVDYWARRGVLSVQRLRGCPGGACGVPRGPRAPRPAADAAPGTGAGRDAAPGAGAGRDVVGGCPATGGGCPVGGRAGDGAPALLVIGKFQNRS